MVNTITRDLVHHLIDELPDAMLEEAARRLTDLRDDQFLRAFLEAPEDDEPLTDEDVAAIEAGKAEIARGEVSDWEDVKQRIFGEP
jgi:predicted transcriptional regulator